MKTISGVILLLLLTADVHAQVNLQTGSAVFSLPMFSWQDDKSSLNTIIALNYNSGNGLKVNDVASNVGQGWNLVAGGVITRMQVGDPDDQLPYYNDNNSDSTEQDNDITKYPAGYLHAPVPAENGCPNALTTYPLYKSKNQLYRQHNIIAEDRQLDYFSFQFNGKSGLFVVDNTSGDIGWPLGDTKMKISFQEDPSMATGDTTGIRTTITSFTIQDADGLIYRFTKHGLSKVLSQNFCDDKQTAPQHQPTFKNGHVYYQSDFSNDQYVNPWVINNWYLSEIEDPLTGRIVHFFYHTRHMYNDAGTQITFTSGKEDYVVISYSKSVTTTPEIDSIKYPDGHAVTFNYSSDERADLAGDSALSSVDITYQGRHLSEYQVKTTYFILTRYGTPVSEYEKSVARLCLQSVKKIGVDMKEDAPPYVFDYYLGSSANEDDFVPPPFFYAKDIWGYYNGSASTGYDGSSIPLNTDVSRLSFNQLKGLCFLKSNVTAPVLNPKAGYAKNGLLRQVIYPTGGTLTYDYSQNTGVLPSGGADRQVGGVHVSQTSSTDGGYQNDCDNPIITYYNYVMGSVGSPSSLWGLENPLNSLTLRSHYAPKDRKFHWSLSTPFGSCYWYYRYPGILSAYQTMSLTRFQNFMTAIGPVLGIVNVITDIMDVATLIGGSTGPGAIVAVALDVIGAALSIVLTCIGDNAKDYTNAIYYNTDLNTISPLPVQFKRVEVVSGNGAAGKTVQTFTSSDDYPVWVPAGTNTAFSAKQRFAPWAYGLPKLITVYDAAGHIIKQTENIYDTTFAKTLINSVLIHGFKPLMSCKCEVLQTTSQRSSDWSRPSTTPGDGGYGDSATYYNDTNPVPPDLMKVDIYPMYTGRVQLDTTYERIYSPNTPSQYLETMTAYTYNSFYNYEVNQIFTRQSNGDIMLKFIRYSSDFHGGVMDTLFLNNIVSLPVTTMSRVTRANGEDEYLGEQVTEYTQVAGGAIKPFRTLEQRFARPASSLNLYWGPGSDISRYKITSVYTYDADGNAIGVQDEGMHTISNIYGYNDKYVIASVANANPLTDKPAYTSFEDTVLGGWTLNGTAAYASAAITGSRSLSLSSGNSLIAPLNVAKSYTLSFWSANGSVSVSGSADLVKSGPAYNGFTYHEYNIPQGAASVTVTGPAEIDELRLYPENARMRTTTYDPLIGKTSECDANNRITYYEYDNLGRLRFVKDENKNTLKMYEYNNVSVAKQNGCPGIYYNHQVSEVFTKSDCSPGTVPDTNLFVYTVPANKYSSTISQADADAKAQTELLTNGKAQANANSRCIAVYYNAALSVTDSTESCEEGYKGGYVTYTVPAGRYSSVISQADADAKAQTEADANAAVNANNSAHAACIFSTDPDWEGDESSQSRCLKDANGNYTGHIEVLMTDMNPNSPTYNSTAWKDAGPYETACPHTQGYAPSLNGASSATGSGVITGEAGTDISITVTLNSSTASAQLTGNVGGHSVNLSGAGNISTTFTVTMPPAGYISWILYLSAQAGASYVSSNIRVN